MKMIKNVFSEFEGNYWAKIACGNVSSQALSACLAERQFNPLVPRRYFSHGQVSLFPAPVLTKLELGLFMHVFSYMLKTILFK